MSSRLDLDWQLAAVGDIYVRTAHTRNSYDTPDTHTRKFDLEVPGKRIRYERLACKSC